jgi:hypothetical protein
MLNLYPKLTINTLHPLHFKTGLSHWLNQRSKGIQKYCKKISDMVQEKVPKVTEPPIGI